MTPLIIRKYKLILVALVALACQPSVAAPVANAEATVLSFPTGVTSQSSVTSLTADSNTVQTGYTNATYDATNGVVVEVAPGTYSFGFGSYVPENFTGPGKMFLHRVLITDQSGNTLLDESFDGWSQAGTSSVSGSITRSTYTTTAGSTWTTYGDGASYLFPPFTTNSVGGDVGISYPMDGSGPFSVLIKTLLNIPSGTTQIRVNLAWTYDVKIFGGSGANRLFTIGLRQGDVPTENLFSFSAPANTAPSASGVSIVGVAQAGNLLSGAYTYSDSDSDVEGASTFRWVVNSVSTGVGGGSDVATTRNYTPTTGDLGKYLYFCVTPAANTGTTPGVEVCSAASGAVTQTSVPASIPTLSEWAMILMASLMALFAMSRMRRN